MGIFLARLSGADCLVTKLRSWGPEPTAPINRNLLKQCVFRSECDSFTCATKDCCSASEANKTGCNHAMISAHAEVHCVDATALNSNMHCTKGLAFLQRTLRLISFNILPCTKLSVIPADLCKSLRL